MLFIDDNTPFLQNLWKPWPYLPIQRNAVFNFILYFFFLEKDFSCFISVFLLSLKMRFLVILALSATFVLPIFADDDDLAIPLGDIPTTCLATRVAVVQQANTC